MAREYKDSASREQSCASTNYAEAQPILERKLKDSGIEWIGEIPEAWDLDTIGNLYSLRQEKVSDKDYPPLSVGKMGVVPQLENAAKTDNGDDRKLVRIGDFAINSRSDRRGSCGISSYEGSVSLINTIITPRNSMNPQYYNWLFHTELFADEFYKWGHGIVDDLWTTRWQEMKRISIVVPSLFEQQTIADFLDEKCGEIDQLVELQQQMIEELKAYKQSVITEAVTKGLNPDVPMKDSASREQSCASRNYAEAQPILGRKLKDSGIEWIGEIPKRYKIGRIKYIASLYGRIGFRGYTSDDLNKDGEGAITLSPSNMIPMGMDYKNVTFLSWEKYNESPEIMIQNGDLLMVKTGSSYGKVSYVNLLPKEATINPQILRIVPHINSKYLGYFLQTPYFTGQVECSVVGGTIPTIAQEKINNFFVPIPQEFEQQAIADYLDKKSSEIDQLIEIKQNKISELKEYKKSLIFEYVTGKKQVV